ncbi:MAG: hypothetical protein ACKO63_07455 [Nodosilinea sp.]
MSQRILNLTLPVVSAKVDQVLRDNALKPTLDILTISDLRDRLTTYVVRRLPAVYVTLESEEAGTFKDPADVANHNYYPEQQLAEIEQLIEQGLRTLMAVEPPYPTATLEAVEDVSCWFG